MKTRARLSFVAVALSICFSQGVAEAKKEVIIDVEKCRANCAAKAKKCALDGVSSVAGCVANKNICLADICGDKPASTTSGTPGAPPADGAN